MISKALEVFAKSMGMNTADDSVYGIYGGYFMTVTERKTRKTVEISCYIGDSDEYSDDYVSINDGIRTVIDKYLISDYGVDETYLSVTSHAELAQFREMIDYLAGMLDELSIYNAAYCSECGAEFADPSKRRIVTEFRASGVKKHLVCESCALKFAESNNGSKKEEDSEEKPAAKRSTAALVSAAAGLCGALIYVLIFALSGANGRGTMLRFAPCLAALLIGGGVILLYRKIASSLNPKDVTVISVITGVITVAAHLFGCAFGFMQFLSRNKGISFSTSLRSFPSVLSLQFNDSKNLSFLVIGAIISLCCAFIAVIFIYGGDYKKKEEQKKIRVAIQSIK